MVSERTKQEMSAFRSQKSRALTMIETYRQVHGEIYLSFKKNATYDWAIQNAYDTIARAYGRNADTPLNILEGLLTKYDAWAHTESLSADQFKVAAAAIEDLIDLLLTS